MVFLGGLMTVVGLVGWGLLFPRPLSRPDKGLVVAAFVLGAVFIVIGVIG
jgi:hypothetical protein